MLIGDIPLAYWKSPGTTASKLLIYYYEDIDGHFLDVNNDGYYDRYSVSEPEIWISLIREHEDMEKETIPCERLGYGGEPGLNGRYFDGWYFTNEVFSRIDPRIHFNWGRSEPNSVLMQNDGLWSVLWDAALSRVHGPTK